MHPFRLLQPRSLDEAVDLLAAHRGEAQVLAGGQDLIFRLKKYLVQPAVVINLKTIPALRDVWTDGEGAVHVGALATLDDLARYPAIPARYAAVAQAAESVASPQIRTLGTLGGNLCQEVWCWYLQDGFACWKAGGRGCDLVNGDSRYYGSIMLGHRCLAVHPSDLAPALAAFDARVQVASPRGPRTLAITELLPGHTLVDGRLQSHVLAPDEILTEIVLPPQPDSTRSVYLKFGSRQSWDFAIASAAVRLDLEDGQCRAARVVLGGVATHPYRSEPAEACIQDAVIAEATAAAAAEAALRPAHPLRNNGYKVQVARTLVKRGILACAGLAAVAGRDCSDWGN